MNAGSARGIWPRSSRTTWSFLPHRNFCWRPPAAGWVSARPSPPRVDARTGRYTGLNCKGAEKVSRFREQYPDAEIGQFFPIPAQDAPLAHLARRAFLVRGELHTLMGGVMLRSRAAAADIFSTTKARP